MWHLVSNYLEYTILVLGLLIFIKYVLHKKIKGNKFLIIAFVFLISLFDLIMYMYGYLLIKTIVLFTLLTSLIIIAFKVEICNALLYAVTYMIIYMSSEILLYLTLMLIFNYSKTVTYNSLFSSIFANVVVMMILSLIIYIFKNLLRKVLNTKISYDVTFYITLLFLVIVFFFYLIFNEEIGLLSGVCVISIMIVIMFTLLLQAYRNNELICEYDKLLEFIRKYEKEIDYQRVMRHEIKNQLLVVKSKIVDNDNNDNIINYINKILYDNKKNINYTLYAKLSYLPSNGIKGLFYFKVSEAIDKGINVNVNVSKNLYDSVLDEMDIDIFNQTCKLLGIILDNAIEGSYVSKKKQMGIEIYILDGEVNFIISNTYIRFVNSKDNSFDRTTKGYGRGYGLSLAKKIITNNDIFGLDTTITDELYIQKLIIK